MALDDCKLKYSDVQQATVGYLFGGTCCGQRALYECGLTGIPIYNVSIFPFTIDLKYFR